VEAIRPITGRTAQCPAPIMTVGDLQFALRRSARRKTLEISVERNGGLLLSVPRGVDEEQLRRFVRQRRLWIYTKLAEKDRRQRPAQRKEYIGGEGFLYLGRSYRLKLVAEQDVPLKLVAGRFALREDALRGAREHFVQWYTKCAKAWLSNCVGDYRWRMEVQPAGVRVQELGYRWGSCGKGGWLYFHWKTILLPARIAEYVVVHEIAHLHEPHHTPAFWRRVERALPDFAQRRDWLSEHGVDVEGI